MIYACERFPDASVVCFEPLPSARAKLLSIAPAGRLVRVHSVALSPETGTARFHVAAADDSSSLMPASKAQVELFPGSREATEIDVQTARMDDVLHNEQFSRPCLLKIDVQGGELGVLQGATATLKQVDYLLVECSFLELYVGQPLADEVIEFLNEHCFSLTGFFSPTCAKDGRVIQADGLFERVNGTGKTAE